MKKSYLAITVLLAALVGVLVCNPPTATASGDGPKGDRGERHERFGDRQMARMTEVLGLSADQQEQIKAITAEHRNKVAPLRQTLDENRSQLRQAAHAGDFDEAAVRTLAGNQAAAQTELIVERARMQNQIQSLLTPEQREKAEKMRSEKGHGRGHHHGGPRR
jgi:protein CpxP